MWSKVRRNLAAILELFLPPVCLACGYNTPDTNGSSVFCISCEDAASPLGEGHCPSCAQPFVPSHSNHLCGTCLKKPPTFHTVYASNRHEGSIRDAIHHLKYRNRLSLAKPLGERLHQTITTSDRNYTPDRVVPVPLHLSRLRRRGYNQALEIARPIALKFSTKIDTSLLQRVRRTPHQQGLKADERRSNLRDAFSVTSPLFGEKVLLVDDVMTTGETARECSRLLMAEGAKEVRVAVVARA